MDLDNKLESENVIAPGQNMEEDRVRGLENKCECATPSNVQVRKKKYLWETGSPAVSAQTPG